MRNRTMLAIAVLAYVACSNRVNAADPWPPGPPPAQAPYSGGGQCGQCDCNECGKVRRCLACMHHCNIEGKDLYYSCGAQGSYKFPVPPLYTYHWPGMYSQQLMTDYHSPWRFPPLKPYTEESKTQPSKTTGNAAAASKPQKPKL